MHIFLDIDGVLRPVMANHLEFDRQCLFHFESAVQDFPEVKIVITSSLRFAIPIAALRARFSADMADRIEGITPEAPPNVTTHRRYAEICAYIRTRGIDDDTWVAVDDNPSLYPEGIPLLVTHPNRGFDEDCAIRLEQMLLEHDCIE